MLNGQSRETLIAYFSMEIGLKTEIPTYSGGLGVLAGDTLKSAADLNLPVVGVSLLYRKGYFQQTLGSDGEQHEAPVEWDPAEQMTLLPHKVSLQLENRKVWVQAWQYDVEGAGGAKLPVYFLDTDLEENDVWDRGITYHLYGGDKNYRLKQEAVLGIGGIRMLRQLRQPIKKFHMNEGHAALLTLELLHESKTPIESTWDERAIWNEEAVKDLCIFTTHTPVEAGHDRFDYELVESTLGDYFPLDVLRELAGERELNMTTLGLNLSNYHNGVAKKHGQVSQSMFPGYNIRSITNGVHTRTWTHPAFTELYDEFIPGWREEPELFVRVDHIPNERIWGVHQNIKRGLLDLVRTKTGVVMDENVLTLGFARRATPYKRAHLLFRDLERLTEIGKGKLQLIYAGKAHPQDMEGKENIRTIIKAAQEIGEELKIVYLQNYDMALALEIIAGVDVWLNTPVRPREASGTSGMKAAHNGVPNFSVLDGWWIEGWIENVTGWSIGPAPTETMLSENNETADIEDLYHKLEQVLIPLYYSDRRQWIEIMKGAIGKNACYFNTHRMMRQYVTEAYIR